MKLFRRQAEPRNANFRHVAHLEHVLGTACEIQIVSTQRDSWPNAERAVLDEILRLDSVFSVYKPDSEFNRWQRTNGEAVQVSEDLAGSSPFTVRP